MGYYDSVKDSVKENNKQNTGSAGGGNFDTLKENAEKTSEEEQKGDDTPIEVLEEDGLSQESPKQKQEKKKSKSQKQNSQQSNPLTEDNSDTTQSQDMSGVEDKLDKIIEQNRKMIEILESFGQ